MKGASRLIIMLALILSPVVCFCWGESKHPITELLIHSLYLDTNFVFCGSDAHWGTNVFGLFVFDRRTETWTNYPGFVDFDSRYGQVKAIEAEGDSVYVTFHNVGTLGFNRHDGFHQQVVMRKWSYDKELSLSINGVSHRVHRDSVIVGHGAETRAYTPSSKPIFSHPLVFQNKIYMASDLPPDMAARTEGIASFDLTEKTFHFYDNEIFEGTVTDGFVHDSLVVFSTARYWYEGNAGPAAGFVAFNPVSATFSIWKGLPLPDEPLAIFQVAQDEREYWIGTDKGVFRIDKRTNETKHYQITKGIVTKDGRYLYSAPGSIVGAQLDKGDEVELLGVLNGWCECRSPKDILGWVEARYVEDVMVGEDTHKNILRFKPLGEGERIPVKAGPYLEIPILVTLNAQSLKEQQYETTGHAGTADEIHWYKIKLPTAWINMNDLIFQLGEL